MASAFAHIAVPVVLCVALSARAKPVGFNFRLFFLGAVFSVMPDADVLAFKFGIPYESPFGHRGFTHSVFFSLVVAGLATFLARMIGSSKITVFSVCFFACLSHALLDSMTNGGLGVALLWPLDEHRYFLPFRPIEVSPIGVKAFFSDRGLQVICSEVIWVFLPLTVLTALILVFKKLFKPKKRR